MAKTLGTILALRMALSPGLALNSSGLSPLRHPPHPPHPRPTGVLLDPPVLPSHVAPAHPAWAQLLEVAAGPRHLVLPGEGRRAGGVPHGSPEHRGSQSAPLQGAKRA